MSRDMILSGIINNLVSTAFTAFMIVAIFLGRKLWMKYGPKPKPKPKFAIKATLKSKYTCPHCGVTAVITPVYEESHCGEMAVITPAHEESTR